jgi:hypothetical protein
MVAASSHATLIEILSAPIQKEELSKEFLKVKDGEFLSTFEDAWMRFLIDRQSDQLPKGERVERIESMQQKVKDLKTSKDSVEVELKRQLNFFQDSRQKLEDQFDAKMRFAMQKQRAIHQELSQQLELTDKVESLQKQTLPWFHFLEEINSLSQQEEEEEESESVAVSRAPKPSGRAMLLTKVSGKDAESGVAQLRAYRADHALLTAHVQMLRKEIQRVESLMLIQEYTGRFLTEYNVLEKMSSEETKRSMSQEEKSVGTLTTRSSAETSTTTIRTT